MTSPSLTEEDEPAGYRTPRVSTRFQKGKSGNPKGRPRNRRREIPYDHVLGQMVTIREQGKERRVTAAEAFILYLTKRGLEGDRAAARASLAALELARSKRADTQSEIQTFIWKSVNPGSVGCILDALHMAVKVNRYSDSARYMLKPWLVQMAVDRLGDRRLSSDEQKVVVDATRNPELVKWPDWWGDV